MVADQLRTGRKSATIRLGDKSGKYKKGMVVKVLCGNRYSAREFVFDAVIDKVEVKTLGELSPREIEHDNPEIRRTDEMAHFLGQLYNREVEGGRRRHGDPLLADPQRPGRAGLRQRLLRERYGALAPVLSADAVAEPACAVTSATSSWPESADVSVYDADVAPAIGAQMRPFALQRSHCIRHRGRRRRPRTGIGGERLSLHGDLRLRRRDERRARSCDRSDERRVGRLFRRGRVCRGHRESDRLACVCVDEAVRRLRRAVHG